MNSARGIAACVADHRKNEKTPSSKTCTAEERIEVGKKQRYKFPTTDGGDEEGDEEEVCEKKNDNKVIYDNQATESASLRTSFFAVSSKSFRVEKDRNILSKDGRSSTKGTKAPPVKDRSMAAWREAAQRKITRGLTR